MRFPFCNSTRIRYAARRNAAIVWEGPESGLKIKNGQICTCGMFVFQGDDPLLQALEGHSDVILTARRTFGQTSHRDGPKIGATADQFPKSIVSLSDR